MYNTSLGVNMSGSCEGYRAQKSQHMNIEEPKFHPSALKMSRGRVITGSA